LLVPFTTLKARLIALATTKPIASWRPTGIHKLSLAVGWIRFAAGFFSCARRLARFIIQRWQQVRKNKKAIA